MTMLSNLSNWWRPFAVAVLAGSTVLAVTLLDQRVDSSRKAQLTIASLSIPIRDLEAAPVSADPAFNPGTDARSPDLASIVAREITVDEAKIASGLSAARREGSPTTALAAARVQMRDVRSAVSRVYVLASRQGGLARAGVRAVAAAQGNLQHELGDVTGVLKELGRNDDANARSARIEATTGTIATIVILLTVFGVFYFRSQRLGREIQQLLGLSREEASTDELTGLGNRRSLTEDLDGEIAHQRPDVPELLIAIYDLDGFKQYNDTFGHPAGDELLGRLGRRLSEVVKESGRAYRMGGDEFCVLARCVPEAAETLLNDTIIALSEQGEGWEIGCSQGAAWVPSEAVTRKEALKCADVRMYANKAGRSSTGRQVADVLMQVLDEQKAGPNKHGGNVARLATDVAVALHQSGSEVQRIRLAAILHDVGKRAMPDSMLNQSGPLDAEQWEFMHGHPGSGERIVLAAPSLANTAPLIRSSHERIDGTGYPDGLRGDEIPLGSRIILACDAYDAMTSNRPYRTAATRDEAIQELRRWSGIHFDPRVVDALCAAVLSQPDSSEPPRVPDVKLRRF